MGKLKAFFAGLAAGAAALFFSKKENRDMVKEKAGELKEKVKEEAEVIKRKTDAAVQAVKKVK